MNNVSQRENSDLLSAYERADSKIRVRHVRISVVLFLLLMPTFAALDWMLYRDYFPEMLRIRLIFDVVFLAFFFLTFTPAAKYIKTIGVVGAVIAGISICWMIAVSEGADSPYYAGLTLILVVMSVLLPWTVTETAVVCCVTLCCYVAACYIGSHGLLFDSQVAPVFFNNMFFLSATSIICITASHFQSARRFEEFRLTFELDCQNKKLAALDRAKTHFFSNISHELRTPLTLILAPVQEMLEGGLRVSDTVALRLGMVRDNGLRLLKLVNDLLDVIRLEERKGSLESIPLDLNSFASGVADSMAHLAETKEISLIKRISADAIVVQADPQALEKLLINLINNSVKFTDRFGRIVIETTRDSQFGLVRVTDNGIGIAKEDQPFIFDRFHQVDGSSTRRYRGSGLGLALVKEITQAMDGEVWVSSALGEGTTMTLSLPLAGKEAGSAAGMITEAHDEIDRFHRLAEQNGGLTLEEPESPLDGFQSPGGMPVILIVEDEPDMRRYLADIVQPEYGVMLARTGLEGFNLAVEKAPDLVLLDLMLPELDGLEVCRRIRESQLHPGPKIMLLTARVDEESKLAALNSGADDFLTKPFSSLEVRTRLRNLVVTRRLEKDLVEQNALLQEALDDLARTQTQLIQSEKLNALGNLSAGLLHEINNPLNYTLTALQLLRGHDSIRTDDFLGEIVSDMEEGMQRIHSIVSDLSAFAYPSEAEKQVSFDFNAAIDSALRFSAHEMDQIQFSSNLPRPAMVLGSKSHLTQVLINLFSNAVKAIEAHPSGCSGAIKVIGKVRDSRLFVHVEDNGIGIGKDALTRIFDPFFTTRDVGEGLGLGLSICHTIIKNHGGELVAESRHGEGSRFSFDLPLEHDHKLWLDAKHQGSATHHVSVDRNVEASIGLGRYEDA